MTALPIAFRTSESKYKFLGSPSLVNCYAEQQGNDAKAPMAVVPSPGMTLFCAVTDTPIRGSIFLADLDVAYVVHNSSVYKIVEAGTATRIGVIPGSDMVQMSRNQAIPVQISITTARGEFYIEQDAVKRVTDEDLPAVISHDHAGGYTVRGMADRRFFLSSINDTTQINGLDYATAEQSADPLVRVKADRGDLYLFKELQTEIWRNTGNPDFPFEPMPGTLAKGLLAANAVDNFDNTLAFPGHDSIVYRLAGSTAQRISNHGIERTIEGDSNPSAILGFSHSGEGHSFFTLTGEDWTRSYDAATQVWHSRESYGLGYWRARCPFRAWGKTIVGDALTGNLYELNKDAFVEGDQPIVWGIDSPILHAFPNGGIVDALHIDVATGVGALTGQGSAPLLMLSWSTDGGNTFKGHRQLSLGARGDRVRVTARRLGRFGPQGIQFRLRVSDPVIRALVNVDAQIRPLKR